MEERERAGSHSPFASIITSSYEHFQNSKQKIFIGYIKLASKNVMKFGRPSRKDDLQSLCYLLLLFTQSG